MKALRFFQFLTIFFAIVLIPACKNKNQQPGTSMELWDQTHIEAKLHDVPVLVNAELMQNISQTASLSESTIISYESKIHLDDAFLFYQEQMERLGWKQTAAFKGAESLLNFEKPQKYCSISLRPNKKLIRVIIFIGQKCEEE